MGRSERKSEERMDRRRRHRNESSKKNERREKSSRQRVKEDDHERQRYRSRSPHDRERNREDKDIYPRVKQERLDQGYERNELGNRERNRTVKIKEEHPTGVKHERETNDQHGNRELSGHVRIKKERTMNIKEEREMNDRRRVERRRHQPENPFQGSVAPANGGEESSDAPPKEKEKPNFEKSGALTEDTNTFRGVVIKYNEPPEARKPKRKWRFYIFKGEQQLPVLHVHRQSAYLLGRDRKIADIPVDHPSCSKQHAVLQYRLTDFTRDDGTIGRRVRPYVIDLESANGTFLNNNKIEPKRYYELQEKDVIKFGFSSRDWVLLHANSKDDDEGD